MKKLIVAITAFFAMLALSLRIKYQNFVSDCQYYFNSTFRFALSKLGEARGSFEITTAFVEGYKNNIHMLAQQHTPRLFGYSRQEQQASKTDYYERIGITEANDVTERHGDTPINNAPHSRRAVTLKDSDWGDMIDRLDRVRLLINPDDAYVKIAEQEVKQWRDAYFTRLMFNQKR